MNHTLSSRSTFAVKFLLPGIWIPLCGLQVIQILRDPSRVHFGGGIHAPPGIAYGWTTIYLLYSAFILWHGAPLKRVRIQDCELLVSNYSHEWHIPRELIEDVSLQRVLLGGRTVTIRLRSNVGCGLSVKFVPKIRMFERFRGESPAVGELRRLAGLK